MLVFVLVAKITFLLDLVAFAMQRGYYNRDLKQCGNVKDYVMELDKACTVVIITLCEVLVFVKNILMEIYANNALYVLWRYN